MLPSGFFSKKKPPLRLFVGHVYSDFALGKHEVSGHDFSRAVSAGKCMLGFSPCGAFRWDLNLVLPFSAASSGPGKSRKTKAPSGAGPFPLKSSQRSATLGRNRPRCSLTSRQDTTLLRDSRLFRGPAFLFPCSLGPCRSGLLPCSLVPCRGPRRAIYARWGGLFPDFRSRQRLRSPDRSCAREPSSSRHTRRHHDHFAGRSWLDAAINAPTTAHYNKHDRRRRRGAHPVALHWKS